MENTTQQAIGHIKNKKGITPIIAIILLLMMTVAAAGAAFYWISKVQGQMQGGVESYQEQLFQNIASKVDVMGATYSSTSQNLTIFFQNVGNKRIPVSKSATYPTSTWILKDPNQIVVCSTDWSNSSSSVNCGEGCGSSSYIEIGEIEKVVLQLGGSICAISSYSAGQLFSFVVDFSGKATTAGSFIS